MPSATARPKPKPTTRSPDKSRYVGYVELAAHLGVDSFVVRGMVRCGLIPHEIVGSNLSRLVTRDVANAFLKRNGFAPLPG